MSQIEAVPPDCSEAATPDPESPAREIGYFALRVYNRIVIILMIYVLSIGPMFWYWHESTFAHGDPFVAKLYYPLVLLCHAWSPFADWLNWYINLWIT